MENYEALCVFKASLKDEELDNLIARIEKKIKAVKGEVEKVAKWGKKPLGFTFQKHKKEKEGNYVFITFKGEKEVPQELKGFLRIIEGLMRFVVAKAGEEKVKEVKEEKIEFEPEVQKRQEEVSGQP